MDDGPTDQIVEAIRLAIAAAQYRAIAAANPQDEDRFDSLARGYSRRAALMLARFVGRPE
jgi:hypothetical protein